MTEDTPQIEKTADHTRWTWHLPIGCWAIITRAHGASHAEMTVIGERGDVIFTVTIPDNAEETTP